MAITTQRSQVKLAKDVKAKATPYFVFGKTSAWDDDKNPPAPNRAVNALSEIIGYKKVSTISMCRPKKPNETSKILSKMKHFTPFTTYFLELTNYSS